MFFETQRTQSTQRIKPLKERFQEEAKASSQRATAMFYYNVEQDKQLLYES